MTPRTRSIVAQVGSFLLAGLLLYLAFRGIDLAEVGRSLRHAYFVPFIPLVGIVLLSHLARAWRWKILLEALPAEQENAPPRKISLKIAYYSVMIGYMVNYAAPRLGEVVRSANLAAQEKRRFTSVLGTVVVDRFLDMSVLILALISVLILLSDQLVGIRKLIVEPLADRLDRTANIALLAGLLVFSIIIILYLLWWFRKRDEKENHRWINRFFSFWESFKGGLLTLKSTNKSGMLILSTTLMWLSYLLMAHIPFIILDMAGTYQLSLIDSWIIMNIGALGIVVPSPGGIGSYHVITIAALGYFYGVPPEPAASYAVLAHAIQLVLYVTVGIVCLFLQGSKLSTLLDFTLQEKNNPL